MKARLGKTQQQPSEHPPTFDLCPQGAACSGTNPHKPAQASNVCILNGHDIRCVHHTLRPEVENDFIDFLIT